MVVTQSKSRGNACIIRCDGCLMDMSLILWMQCTICHIDICPLCVFKRVQINKHHPSHPYRVVKNLSFPADFPDWQLLEELLFIDGLIIYGVGNWEDLSSYIGRKTVQETKTHFLQVFSIEDNEDLEDSAPLTNLQSNPLSQEISGYMPLREDFDLEYNNDAELVIKEITITKADTQLEKEMKEALLDSYRHVLIKRKLFRHLVLKKDLINARKKILLEKSLCTSGKDILTKIKPFLKVLSPNDFLVFFQGLYLEISLRKKIKSLIQQNTQLKKQDLLFTKKPVPSEEILQRNLSKIESLFCTSLSIPPSVYLLLKEVAVINEISQEKDRKSLSKLFQGISEQKLTQVIEFFVQNKWIKDSSTLPVSSSPHQSFVQ